jgi:hypothetical protein
MSIKVETDGKENLQSWTAAGSWDGRGRGDSVTVVEVRAWGASREAALEGLQAALRELAETAERERVAARVLQLGERLPRKGYERIPPEELAAAGFPMTLRKLALLFRPGRYVLLGYRTDVTVDVPEPGAWAVKGGHGDPDEPLQAAWRLLPH